MASLLSADKQPRRYFHPCTFYPIKFRSEWISNAPPLENTATIILIDSLSDQWVDWTSFAASVNIPMKHVGANTTILLAKILLCDRLFSEWQEKCPMEWRGSRADHVNRLHCKRQLWDAIKIWLVDEQWSLTNASTNQHTLQGFAFMRSQWAFGHGAGLDVTTAQPTSSIKGITWCWWLSACLR